MYSKKTRKRILDCAIERYQKNGAMAYKVTDLNGTVIEYYLRVNGFSVQACVLVNNRPYDQRTVDEDVIDFHNWINDREFDLRKHEMYINAEAGKAFFGTK